MPNREVEPNRWIYRSGSTLFTIFNAGDHYNLTVGENLQVIGTYPTPTEAAIALSNKTTQSEEWNKYLEDKEVPSRFKDWETEEEE